MEESVITCSYHTRNNASWICDSCQIYYCDDCIPYGHSLHWGANGPKCIECNRPLLYNAESEDIPPFWTQLPNFLRYSAHKDCLTFIGLIALASVVLPLLTGLGFLGILLFVAGFLLLLSLTFKYSFLIIEKRSMNNENPPSYDELLDADEDFLFIKLVVATSVLYGAAAFLSGDSTFMLNVFNGIVALLLPAITIILALEKSIVTTLNPMMIASFIGRIGWPYLLLWLCYQIITGGAALLYWGFANVLPDLLLVPVVLLVTLFFWFSANCMLGYVVYQYHNELGHTAFLEYGDDDTVSKIDWERKRALAEAYIHVREKRVESARNLLRPLLDQYAKDKELHLFYHRILALLDDVKSLRNHADYAIDFLMDSKDTVTATALYLDTLKKLPSYQPNKVSNALGVARCLDQRGQRNAIVKLLNNIHKVEPKSKDIPHAYFLLAKVYNEHLGKDAEALKIVRFLLDKFPQFSERQALVAYAKALGVGVGVE